MNAKDIGIGAAVAALLLAAVYVLGIAGWIGERTVTAKPAGPKDAATGLVFFLPRTDLSVRVDWVLLGCEIDTSGPQPVFTPRLALSVAVTPVIAADPEQAFALDPATARPLFGSEEVAAKLTEAQTLAELSYSANDAILQIPGQVQKFQQQFASIVAPFNISSLTSGEPEPPKAQSAYCRPETLNLIERLRQADDASINAEKDEIKRKDAAALARDIRERLTIRLERPVRLDADAVRKGLSVNFLPNQRALEQMFTRAAATRISTIADKAVMQLQLRVDAAPAPVLPSDESAGLPYRVGAPARVRACVAQCGTNPAADDQLYSDVIALPQLGPVRKLPLRQRMFTDSSGRIVLRPNGAVESIKLTSKPAGTSGGVEPGKPAAAESGKPAAPSTEKTTTPPSGGARKGESAEGKPADGAALAGDMRH